MLEEPEVANGSGNGKGKRKASKIDNVLSFLQENASKGVAIFTHPVPDPDAIGSMMGLSWLLQRAFDCDNVRCFYDGIISHPQNQRMCNLLDPNFHHISSYDPDKYGVKIVVDTVPNHAAVCNRVVDFDLVVDHHKEIPVDFDGIFFNIKAGSCCSTIYQFISNLDVKFESDSDADQKVATALLVGITTDTDNLMSDDTTEYDFFAYQNLFDFRDPIALKQIVRYKRPKSWIKARADIASLAPDALEDGILIHGIGPISGNNRDLLVDLAEDTISWENVETSGIFAIVDGNRIEGCIRSNNAAVTVPNLCKELGGEHGEGGGKLGKGAYSFGLGSLSEDGDDDDTRSKFWEYLRDRETKRLLRIIKKMGNG